MLLNEEKTYKIVKILFPVNRSSLEKGRGVCYNSGIRR